VAWTPPPNILGLIVSGDVGDVTFYMNKNRKIVAFPKDWRQEKTSPARLRCRQRFAAAQATWRPLTRPQKQSLEKACRRLSIPMTGQNLWISTALTGDVAAYQTVQRQSGVPLPAPPDQVD